MANFFIDRPIFAWVLAILLCLTGTLAIFSLPVERSRIFATECASDQLTIPAHRPRRWKTP
ncbi:efflux RND transporter permease subunit [Escherichia coli]